MQACSVCHVDAAAVAKSQAAVLRHAEVHAEPDVAKQPAVLQLAVATTVAHHAVLLLAVLPSLAAATS